MYRYRGVGEAGIERGLWSNEESKHDHFGSYTYIYIHMYM